MLRYMGTGSGLVLALSLGLLPRARGKCQPFCYGRWAWAQGLCNDADMQTQFVVFHGLPFFGSLFIVWENTIRERRGTSAETGQRSVAHRTSAFECRARVPFSLLRFHSFWIQGGWERKVCKNYTCGCVRSLGNLFRIFSPYDSQHLQEIFRGFEGCSRSMDTQCLQISTAGTPLATIYSSTTTDIYQVMESGKSIV